VKAVTAKQASEAGQAFCLICLIAALVIRDWRYVAVGTGILVAAMAVPTLFKLPARLWFALSEVLGAVVSNILLSAIFYLLVTPVGLLRRAMGKDTLRLRQFGKGQESVFTMRETDYGKSDVESPF